MAVDEEIDKLGNELVSCNLNCEGITNNPKKGIIPRCLFIEKRQGTNKCVIVGLNPGHSSQEEQQDYLSNGCSYDAVKKCFNTTKLKNKRYFKKTNGLMDLLGYNGDRLWTDLAKCECSGKNGTIPVQTLRVCINKFLSKEIEIYDARIIFALGNVAFKFCALRFPRHFIVGIPHPSGSYGDFDKLRKKIEENLAKYKHILSIQKDNKGNYIAIHLSEIQ